MRRKRLRLLGYCSCGNFPADGFKTCSPCRTFSAERAARCKSAGKCGCGKPPLPNRKKCESCTNHANKRTKNFRDAGFCYCGKSTPAKGYEQCSTCLDKKNSRNAVLRSEGKCQCGKRSYSAHQLCATCREKARNRIARLIGTDTGFAATVRLRNAIYCALKKRPNVRKQLKTESLLGCTIADARMHIESLFQPGMTWANGDLWHIDHYLPCSSFDLTDERQQKLCNNWRNLRPMWASENLSKKDKLPNDYAERLAELEKHVHYE